MRGAAPASRALPHPFLASRVGTLLGCFREYGWPDAPWWTAGVLAFCALRVPFNRLEERLFAGRIAAQAVTPPVFIVGHWRSGTTHLHQLLCQDPQFGFVSLMQAGFPRDFLTSVAGPLFAASLPPRRPMDNVAVTTTGPMEEELAMACLAPCSFYHSFFFPRQAREIYRRSVHFEGVPPAEAAEWWRTYRRFLQKVQYAQPGKRLVLKNPANSARITTLRREFPGAKFIHIHRNPEKVYASAIHLHARLREAWAVRARAHAELPATVLANYRDLMEALDEQSSAMAENEFTSIPLTELEAEPLAALGSIYHRLELPGFHVAKPLFSDYLARMGPFEGNQLSLSQEERAAVRRALSCVYERWGYA